MAIPTGPASRPRKKTVDGTGDSAPTPSQPAQPAQPSAATAVTTPVHRPTAPQLVPPQATAGTPPAQASRPSVRQSGRIPSEQLPRDWMLSPAVLGLSIADFFELHYHDELRPADVTIEEFFRMRDHHNWPDPFPSGDPRNLFTEDMCRRGGFVPIAWNQEGVHFATHLPDEGQDELAKALDLLTKLPVTLYTVGTEQVDAGIHWLYKR